jgi:hypothetical protein
MRRFVLGFIFVGTFLALAKLTMGQDSLQTIEDELKEAKQQQQDATSETVTTFFTQVDGAMASPDAAVSLYEQAGGAPPKPAPVVSEHEVETPTEKDARLAIDQANLTRLGQLLQLHCGMLHYAALFVTKPDQKGLHDDWLTWLKNAAQSYSQISATGGTDGGDTLNPAPRHRRRQNEGDAPPRQGAPENFSGIKQTSMRDSAISKFLAFKLWGEKEQGNWSVASIPNLYLTNVLTPLRTSPTTATLAAWDIYIAMLGGDTPDNDQWNQSVYPPLQFERACDDYTVTPSTEKLEALVDIIKLNPTHPKADEWIGRVHKLVEDYRANHGGAPETNAATTNAAPSDPNVSTVQQGDMTIITTHPPPTTNAPTAH